MTADCFSSALPVLGIESCSARLVDVIHFPTVLLKPVRRWQRTVDNTQEAKLLSLVELPAKKRLFHRSPIILLPFLKQAFVAAVLIKRGALLVEEVSLEVLAERCR